MNKSFQVIIPVINIDLVDNLLNSISINTITPARIIIINNSNNNIKNLYGLPVDIYSSPIPLSVNPSWNLGISHLTNCDFVSILNDDIELPKLFFANLANVFEKFPYCGAICPDTVNNNLESFEAAVPMNATVKMQQKEGWAFTIRKSLLDRIPPIHSDLQLFFGDDWFWWHTYKGGFYWYKDYNSIVHHLVGASLRMMCKKERNIQKRKERVIWYNLKFKFMQDPIYSKGDYGK